VVAFSYLAYLKSQGALNGSIPNHPDAKLKGVITLDSPIGGVTNNQNYLGWIVAFYANMGCPAIKKLTVLESVAELMAVFQTASYSHPQGGKASLKGIVFGGKAFTNQQIADAASQNNIPVLTIGNMHDILWDPSVCPVGGGDFL